MVLPFLFMLLGVAIYKRSSPFKSTVLVELANVHIESEGSVGSFDKG